ncbi:MAG TPA: glycosyltransferase family 39 protein [Candidatus Eisenbacteria bacterium]
MTVRPLHGVLLAAVLLAGAALREHVVQSIPGFFGPSDPAIYFGMGRGVLRDGIPRQDFIHHFLSRPRTIAHVEDYYEPLYAYPVALAMALGGGTPAAAAQSSVVFGVLAIVVVWALARRHGPIAALAAAAIVTFEPWAIYYSGVLMKEALVCVLAPGFLWFARREIEREAPAWSTGLRLALATVAAGLFQYEILPILGIAVAVTLGLRRRSALPAYALAASALVAGLVAGTWIATGVPLSAKFLYFLGHVPGDPEPPTVVRGLDLSVRSLLPLEFIARTLLLSWYPLVLFLGLAGLFAARTPAVERTLTLTFLGAYLYLHAIPVDLWNRDFIPLTFVLAPPAAAALTGGAWRERRALAAGAWAMLFFLWGAPSTVAALGAWSRAVRAWGMWPKLGLGAGLALAGLGLGLALARTRAGGWLQRVTPLLLATSLAAGYWEMLPYPSIWANSQYPDFEVERARRERVGHWMKETVAPGAVLAAKPEEIAYYSGFPAVVMPDTFHPGSVARLAARYRLRYLLVEPGAMPDSVLGTLPVRPLGEREGCRLFAF